MLAICFQSRWHPPLMTRPVFGGPAAYAGFSWWKWMEREWRSWSGWPFQRYFCFGWQELMRWKVDWRSTFYCAVGSFILPYIFPNVVETVLLVSLDMFCRGIRKFTKVVGMTFHSVCGGHVEGGTSTIDEMIGLCTTWVFTLPETNIAPENDPLEKEIPIGNHHF